MAQDDLSKRTKKHLLLLAKQRGLTRASRLRKEELIAQLRAMPASSTSGSAAVAQDDLSAQTHRSLLALAKQRGLTEVGRLRKTDLISRLGVCAPTPHTLAAPAVSIPKQSESMATQPVNGTQQDVTSGKFFPHSAEPADPPPPTLPSGYSDNRIVLLARDPYWLYSYWDFSTEQIRAALAQLDTQDVRPILRVSEVTYVDFDGTNAWAQVDIELTPFATNWYIHVPRSDASYCVEIGYQAPDGRFAKLGRSNAVTTPRDGASPETTPRWFTPPERQPSPTPPPESQPGPLIAPRPMTSGGQETLSSPSAPFSGDHPSSWSLTRASGPAFLRGGTVTH